ncbi:MAG TPA: peptide chain release factor N(5)-glutamine methyltransferase [Caulobacterales bacterium]|nr:peptide chain release factor N(5)-glutamine methyltransferase [Caulobacterales bacterium]
MTLTLLSAWKSARDRLAAAGVDSPALDARMLIEAATGVTRLEIVTDPYRALDADAQARAEALIVRREAREPVSQIVGYRDFRVHRFAVTKDVLTPRPETELLVEVALERVALEIPQRVVDFGIGSGAILLSILSQRPLADGVGVDISREALAVAKQNAAALEIERVTFVHSDWDAEVDGLFDLVVSNPPYIRTGALSLLDPEVGRYEPYLALDGGPDGLDGYRAVLAAARRLLKPGGSFAVELGQGQAEAVWALADEIRLMPEDVRDDLAGIARVLVGRAL